MLRSFSSGSILCSFLLLACGDDGMAGTGSATGMSTTGMSTSPTTAQTDSADTSDTSPSTEGSDSGSQTTGAPAECGNAIVEAPEECDDGNTADDDGCASDCTKTTDTSVWTKTHDGGKSGADGGFGVTVDSMGNIVVVGFTLEDPTLADIWVRKYDTDGNELWTDNHAGAEPTGDDRGLAVATAVNDDIVVVGTVQDTAGNSDVWMRRYDSEGNELWTQSWDGSAGGDDQANGVAVSSDGDILVGGTTRNAAGNNDIWIGKFDGTGMEIWVKEVDGPANTDDQGRGIAVDSTGNVVVAGWVAVPDESSDAWVGKYDPSGVEIWTETFGGPSKGEDRFDDIVVDGDDNILAAGHTTQGAGDLNVFLRKYDPDKALLFTHFYNSPFSANDAAQGIAADGSGNFVVAGYKTVATSNQDIWTRKFEPGGAVLWTQAFAGMAGVRDEAHDVAIDAGGNIFLVGQIRNNGENADVWVAKLAP